MSEFNPELLKVKAKRLDNEEWVEGWYRRAENESRRVSHYVYGNQDHVWLIDPATICRCTGEVDQYEKLIFEGDEISYNKTKYVLSYSAEYLEWYISTINLKSHYLLRDCYFCLSESEIIGNIHDSKGE